MTTKQYLTQEETARYLEVSIATLTAHRSNGTGINFIKLGRLVRYKLSEVKKWKKEKKAGIKNNKAL